MKSFTLLCKVWIRTLCKTEDPNFHVKSKGLLINYQKIRAKNGCAKMVGPAQSQFTEFQSLLGAAQPFTSILLTLCPLLAEICSSQISNVYFFCTESINHDVLAKNSHFVCYDFQFISAGL